MFEGFEESIESRDWQDLPMTVKNRNVLIRIKTLWSDFFPARGKDGLMHMTISFRATVTQLHRSIRSADVSNACERNIGRISL